MLMKSILLFQDSTAVVDTVTQVIGSSSFSNTSLAITVTVFVGILLLLRYIITNDVDLFNELSKRPSAIMSSLTVLGIAAEILVVAFSISETNFDQLGINILKSMPVPMVELIFGLFFVWMLGHSLQDGFQIKDLGVLVPIWSFACIASFVSIFVWKEARGYIQLVNTSVMTFHPMSWLGLDFIASNKRFQSGDFSTIAMIMLSNFLNIVNGAIYFYFGAKEKEEHVKEEEEHEDNRDRVEKFEDLPSKLKSKFISQANKIFQEAANKFLEAQVKSAEKGKFPYAFHPDFDADHNINKAKIADFSAFKANADKLNNISEADAKDIINTVENLYLQSSQSKLSLQEVNKKVSTIFREEVFKTWK